LNQNVYWRLELNIKPGKLEAFRAITKEMVAFGRLHEPGTLHYELSINTDGTECHIYERYVDSDAALVHMSNFKTHFSERFMDCVQPTKFVVYGHPSDKLKAVWPPGVVQIFEPFVGFE